MHAILLRCAAVLSALLPLAATAADIPSVTIGRQVWMARNLDVTTFRNGDPIAAVPDGGEWTTSSRSGIPAYTTYAGDAANRARWGLLYNHFAVVDPRGLCPAGWRVPTDADWNALEATLGRERAALRMKAAAGWNHSGNGTDDVGFGGLPAGFRSQTGAFFLDGRVYYTKARRPWLYYRYLSPDSNLVGCTEFTLPTVDMPWSQVRGMTWVAGNIVYGATDGALRAVPFDPTASNGRAVDAAAVTVVAPQSLGQLVAVSPHRGLQ